MTVIEKVQTILEGSATVTALVPATRIRPSGNWQNVAAPYVIHFPVAARSEHMISGLAALRHYDYYQVSIFATTISAAKTIYDAVISALDGYQGKFQIRLTGGSVYVGRDDDLNLEHLVANFAISGHET